MRSPRGQRAAPAIHGPTTSPRFPITPALRPHTDANAPRQSGKRPSRLPSPAMRADRRLTGRRSAKCRAGTPASELERCTFVVVR